MPDEWACPRCGSTEHSVPVWGDRLDFRHCEPPDYIGCTACREMEELDDG